jgi:murein L,D-transpeptidase YcbB/YkuD
MSEVDGTYRAFPARVQPSSAKGMGPLFCNLPLASKRLRPHAVLRRIRYVDEECLLALRKVLNYAYHDGGIVPNTISLGSTGDDVERLQRVLARMLQWNPFGPITGIFDAGLETSVKSFQQANGLTVDGIVGPATWAALPSYREASPTLTQGSTGPAVGWLQQALTGADVVIEFAPYTGAIDGIFGPLTDAAVRSLQTWAGTSVNGIVGDDTWFTWLTPGSAQQLTLERACGLLDRLP